MTSNHSQCMRMIEYMKEHGSVTTLEAVIKLGILSPTKVICDIRKRYGFGINKETLTVTNRYGENVRIKRYSLKEDEE